MNSHELATAGPKPRTAKPVEIRDGNTKLKIYRGECRKAGKAYPLFTLCYYESGERKRKAFGALATAKEEAGKIARRLEQGERDVQKLTNGDQQSFALATRELSATGVPLLDAVRQYIAAMNALPVGTSLLEAASDYAKRHPQNVASKTVPDIVAEFLAAKKEDGASPVYLRALQYHLKPLRDRFKTPIVSVTARDLDAWLRSLGRKSRTRRNALVSVTTMFRYARSQGYLAKGVPTEAEAVARPKKTSGDIGIITASELAKILGAADTAEKRIYFALGAFTGIRAAELARLEWKHIDLAGRHVEITAANAKTASRRLVPICDALFEWLQPYADRKGKLFTSHRAAERLVEWARKIIGRWPSNALRHTWVSCRVAQTQNVAQTALEAGNSPQMVFSNYRQLVTPSDAEKWFSIAPEKRGKIVAMPKGAAA